MRRRRPGAVLLALGLAVAASASASEPLPRVRPGAVGIDAGRLEAALDAFEAVVGARSMVVVRRGAVVGERYWTGEPGGLNNVASVTKSVTSTLVGIAIERGLISGLDARMVDYLPPELVPDDPAKDAITIRHLLTMTSGLRYDEDAEFLLWSRSRNPARYVLDRPLAAPPGTRFDYSSADPHLLSIVLATAVGVPTLDFADAVLFGPLGITERRWPADPQGFNFGGHGLALRTEDMARLGLLFLGHGVWDGDRVVSGSWTVEATSEQVKLGAYFESLTGIDYGWLWWLFESLEPRAFVAWGWGGQFVFCVPELDLVVATSAAWNVGPGTATRQERGILLDVILDRLLPAVGRLPARRPAGRTPVVPARSSGRVRGVSGESGRRDGGTSGREGVRLICGGRGKQGRWGAGEQGCRGESVTGTGTGTGTGRVRVGGVITVG